jgi:hypothetical protein
MPKNETASSQVPWILQLHQDGEIDLDKELNNRFSAMPVMSTIKVRQLDADHGVAMIAMQDGAAVLRVDVDLAENLIEFIFTYQGMLGLKFVINQLGSSQRLNWLQQMRRERGRPVFCWGPNRWQSDYVITVTHPYFTNLYAFSTGSFEAAARLTPGVIQELLDWLEKLWHTSASRDDTLPRLTTW